MRYSYVIPIKIQCLASHPEPVRRRRSANNRAVIVIPAAILGIPVQLPITHQPGRVKSKLIEIGGGQVAGFCDVERGVGVGGEKNGR